MTPQPFSPRSRRLLGAVAGLLLGSSVLAGSAHQPWFNEGSPDHTAPYALRTPIEISQVVYSGFDGPGQVDWYTFDAPAGHQLDVNLVVSDHARCATFKPAFTITGPGISPDGQPTVAATPPAGPRTAAGAGAATIAGQTWERKFEPFSKTWFVAGPAYVGELDGGTYTVAVYDPTGAAGTYGLTFGGSEVRGGQPDFVQRFPAWVACEPVRGAATPVPRSVFDPSA